MTLLADNLQLTKLLSQGLRQKLKALGVQYIRNLFDESARGSPEFYSSWQEAYQTEDMEVAFEKGNKEDSILMWHDDGRRRTKQRIWKWLSRKGTKRIPS